ncbi:MAG: IS701 family transposase [Planctomycetota bacterium]
MNADQIRSLQPELAVLLERFRGCFEREATFAHCQRYVLGLMTDLKRKSVEPIALAAGVAVRTLQEFLSHFAWDEFRLRTMLQQRVADRQGSEQAIGVIDGSGHAKQGDKTPGVQRQWCGETGKVYNCVVGQHLLYTDNDSKNPFSCMLASDLYLPKEWDADRRRCRAARIPDSVVYQPKWRIAIDQLAEVLSNGIRLAWVTFDEEYGNVPAFWFSLNALGQRGIGEVPSNFLCWPTYPSCHSRQGPHAAKRADNVCRYSPVFTEQGWYRMTVKQAIRGPVVWEVKTARVHLVDTTEFVSKPTDRQYGLIVARHARTGEIKYFVSNASAKATLKEMMTAAFARWHVEKWFERAKQECGFGAFEVRTYVSLIRHWLCSSLAMYFLTAQTQRLRGEKSADHLRASGRGGQHPGLQRVEPLVALAG